MIHTDSRAAAAPCRLFVRLAAVGVVVAVTGIPGAVVGGAPAAISGTVFAVKQFAELGVPIDGAVRIGRRITEPGIIRPGVIRQ